MHSLNALLIHRSQVQARLVLHRCSVPGCGSHHTRRLSTLSTRTAQSRQNKKTIAFNCKLAEDLKEGSPFAFKDVEIKTGLYKHPIRSLAVVLAGVENNIDECLTGIMTDQRLPQRLRHPGGRFYSGAQPLNTPSTIFSKQVLDAALKEYEEGWTTLLLQRSS
ncbi:hypothetical protein B0H13DRAFT_2688221 [Mycena leptocephala]|nr:hypothetical protein B0H13DRAFT_2688221 [Mycena leptocephala]